MSKVTITTQRFLQNQTPFLGKIVFTLKGDPSPLVTSFIPGQGIFCNGKASVLLVPNSEIEEAQTYYHYGIYPQGHIPGIFLSEPVEEGICIVPDHDCILDDIIMNDVPDKETAEQIIANASSLIAEIRAAITQAEECAERACQSATAASNSQSQAANLKLETEQYYFWVKTRQEAIEAATAILDNYQQNIEQMVHSLFQQETDELQRIVNEEQRLVNDLWNKLHQMFVGLDDVRDLLSLVRNLHETFTVTMRQLEEYVAQLHIPTKLSDLENDLFEPITNEEIVSLF